MNYPLKREKAWSIITAKLFEVTWPKEVPKESWIETDVTFEKIKNVALKKVTEPKR